MAQFSLTISRWRMLRLALRKKQSRFEDLRSMARRDQSDVDWLVKNGLLAEVADGVYELTTKGHESTDMGFYEWEPPRRTAPTEAGAGGKTRRGKK